MVLAVGCRWNHILCSSGLVRVQVAEEQVIQAFGVKQGILATRGYGFLRFWKASDVFAQFDSEDVGSVVAIEREKLIYSSACNVVEE